MYSNKQLSKIIKYKYRKTFFIKKIKNFQKEYYEVLINQYNLKIHLKTINCFFNHLILLDNLQFILNKLKEHITLNKKLIKFKSKNKVINH